MTVIEIEEAMQTINQYIEIGKVSPELAKNQGFIFNFYRFITNYIKPYDKNNYEVSTLLNAGEDKNIGNSQSSTTVMIGIKYNNDDKNSEIISRLKLLEMYLDKKNQTIVYMHSGTFRKKTKSVSLDITSEKAVYNNEGFCYIYKKYVDTGVELPIDMGLLRQAILYEKGMHKSKVNIYIDYEDYTPLSLLSCDWSEEQLIYVPTLEDNDIEKSIDQSTDFNNIILPKNYNKPFVMYCTRNIPKKDTDKSYLKIQSGTYEPNNAQYSQINNIFKQNESYKICLQQQEQDGVEWIANVDNILNSRGLLTGELFRNMYDRRKGRLSQVARKLKTLFRGKNNDTHENNIKFL